MGPMIPSKKKGVDEAMSKVVTTSEKIANEEKAGLMAAMVKEKLFGGAGIIDETAHAIQANGQQDAHMSDVKAAE
jgi:COP9 signalosome complex subunit 5